MAGPNGVVIRFLADTSSAIRNINKLERATGKSMGAMGKVSTVWSKTVGPALATGALAAGAAIGYAAINGIKSAIDDQSSQAKLAQALKNTVGATAGQVSLYEEYIAAAQKKTGFDDTKLRAGNARLLRSTKNITRAQQLSNAAMEIAAATGKDYETVANAIAKAEEGNTTALKRLGITVGPAAQNYADLAKANKAYAAAQDLANQALADYGPKSQQYADALKKVAASKAKIEQIKGSGTKWLKEVNKQFTGSVATDATTYAGGIRRVATAWSELEEAFGTGVMTGGGDATGQMSDFAQAMYDAQPTAQILGENLGEIATGISNIAQALVNAKTAAEGNPIWDFLANNPASPVNFLLAPSRAAQAGASWINDQFGPQQLYYDQYRPMAVTQRTRTAAKGADGRAAQKAAKTRTNP